MASRPIELLAITALFLLGAGSPTSAQNVDAQVEAALRQLSGVLDPNTVPPFRTAVFAKAPRGYENLGPPGPFFPAAAAMIGMGGVAVIQCKLALSGQLSACEALAEHPAKAGFGVASEIMAKRGFLVASPAVGDPEDQVVRVVVVFPTPKKR